MPGAPAFHTLANVKIAAIYRLSYVRQYPDAVSLLTPTGIQSQPPTLRAKYDIIPLSNFPLMAMSDLAIIRKLGQGTSGKVFEVKDRDTGRALALKVIRKKNCIQKRSRRFFLSKKILPANVTPLIHR